MKRLTWWQRAKLTWTGREARREYFAAEERLGHLHRELAIADWCWDRSELLASMARAQEDQARVFTAGWGWDWIASDPMDMAESLRWRVTLYEILAAVEFSVAMHQPRQYRPSPSIEAVAGDVLDRMAGKVLLGDRMALLPELWRAVYPVVGGQAAEVVHTLPYPDGRVLPAEKSTR